ncbi:MAG: 3-deoxy-manno-octulosonate cytidylyltransferase [Alphaproteobacteria bacterium]|jgi:3-deoxy-manno-octulosonate cytidylyltransferase (CMP-KDO synthetase)|nr:3-deoxy-manno-octulosonate cytidylyltransferase [Alphaproteobacteria bacterium]
MKTCVIIPCRAGSERLAKKHLVDINGKSLMQRVYESVITEFNPNDVYIAIDNDEYFQHAISFGAQAIMTDPNCPSGTDRIAQALDIIDPNGDKYDFVINFQGDDVNVNPKISQHLAEILEKNNADLVTVVQPIDDEKLIMNSSVVKVAIVQSSGRCLYFSRSPIPFNRKEGCTDKAFWHIGMYAYNLKSLRKFIELPVGELEKTESLEQLRFLENGMSVFAVILDDTRIDKCAPADVNTAEDLEEIRKYIK